MRDLTLRRAHRPQEAPTEFDCIIVGSGPVGAATADVLVRAGLTVAMLESGDEPERDRFNVMERSLDNSVAWDFAPWQYEMQGDDLNLNTFAVRKGGREFAGVGSCVSAIPGERFPAAIRNTGSAWTGRSTTGSWRRTISPQKTFMGVSGHDDNPFLPKRETPFPYGRLRDE